MRKSLPYIALALLAVVFITACRKGDGIKELKKSCLYKSKDDFFKNWGNTFTQVDVYSGSVKKTKLIYPYGYFEMNNDLSYDILTDGIPHTGTWNVNDSCELVLDKYIPRLTKAYEVLKINSDSLVLRRKSNDTVYTQHFASFICPTATQLQNTWNNTFTRNDYFNSGRTAITYSYTIAPIGYFKMNVNGNYEVLSSGDSRGGTWKYEAEGCRITLDRQTSNERTFDILQYSKDSLTIWRYDLNTRIALTQQYKKN